MKRLEQRPEILNVWLAHGFPLGDVPTTGVKVVVVTDDDRARGDEIAEQMGRRFFEIRAEAVSRPDTIKACLDKVSKAAQGPITIADTADNSGAGASSDSTFFLSEMVARKIENAAIAAIWDPVAVSICKDAGVGANLRLRIGGKVDSISGDPLDVSATVIGLADDVKQKMGGIVFDLGVCAAIKVHPGGAENLPPDRGIDVVLSQKRSQPFTPDIFSDLGIDPAQKKILVVKSMQHFYAGFEPISKAIYYAGDLGSTISDVMQICYKRLNTTRFWPFVVDPCMK